MARTRLFTMLHKLLLLDCFELTAAVPTLEVLYCPLQDIVSLLYMLYHRSEHNHMSIRVGERSKISNEHL